MKKGIIDVIMGPMFCGKSDEISRRLRKDKIAGRTFSVIKPVIDNRYGETVYRDRNNTFSCPAINAPVESITPKEKRVLLEMLESSTVVAIDEAQFFGNWIVSFISELKKQGKKVYVGGLDTDYLHEPFGFMGDLCCLADQVLKLKAVCVCCGEDATHTQRLADGKPAPEGEKVVIGDKEKNAVSISYEARCADHYVHPSEVIIEEVAK